MANFFIGMINVIIKALGTVLGFLISVLPDSPFQSMASNATIQKYVSYLNWIVPVGTMLYIAEAWLLAIAVYYVYQIVLRFVKVIE